MRWTPGYLQRPGLGEDGTGCRWIAGLSLIPGLYFVAADYQHKWQRERKLHIDIGRATPAWRQIHLNYVTLRKGTEV